MENRFGIKDFFLFLILLLLIGVVLLAMTQYDRQWNEMRTTNSLLTQQTTDLARIRRLLEQGVSFGAATTSPTTQNALAGFENILKSQAQPDYAMGDDLVDTFMAMPHRLTPIVSSDLASRQVQAVVLDSLCDRDQDTLEWEPRLATKWTFSPDRLQFEFELRRGVTFSDGSPFTADDVVFTFDFMRDERIEAPRQRAYLDKLDKVEKTGEYSVRFSFKEPYFKSFEIAAGNEILCKAFYSRVSPTDFNRSTGLLLGSGPYRLPNPDSWRPEPGKPLIVVRNERYWGPTPTFNRIVWKTIDEASARSTAFRNGDIDIYGGSTSGITPEQYDQMVADPELAKRTQHWVIETPTQGMIFIGWNERIVREGPSVFADVRVRKAMTMLTDRQAIVRDIMRGYAFVISGGFSPLSPQCDATVKPWPYDPAAAEALLGEAGFKRRGDRLIGPDGKPFQFKLMYNTSNETRRRIASLIRDSYAKAGILVELEPTEFSVCIKRMNDRQYEAYLGGWGGVIESDANQIFHSSQIAGTGDNFTQFSDERVDRAIELARSEVVDAKRWPLWHEVHRLLHEGEPYTFLYEDKDMQFLTDRFRGVRPTRLGLNSVHDWYTPATLQKYRE